VLSLARGTRIFMAVAPVDMRRSFDGLCAAVMEVLQSNPLEGHLFLFRGKRADRVKALYWDHNGLVIWYKRLEKGKYKWPAREAASLEISEQELALLLDGVDFTRLRRLPQLHAHVAL
jgi:transposase